MRQWLLVLLVLAMSFVTAAQSRGASPAGGTDPADIVGTWELNLRNSSWGGLPPPRSATINVLRYDGREMQWTAEETDENGNTISLSWQGTLDGTPAEVSGTDSGIYYSFQPSEDGIYETTTFPDGSRTNTLATVANNGQTRILRRHMSSPRRGELDWTEVYDKAQAR
jgi:hypothetical protein